MSAELEMVTAEIALPAGGMRVIRGWKDSGRTWFSDDPVLWFNAEHQAVVPDIEGGVETLDGGVSNERHAFYHPDGWTIGADPDTDPKPRDMALMVVRDALAGLPDSRRAVQ